MKSFSNKAHGNELLVAVRLVFVLNALSSLTHLLPYFAWCAAEFLLEDG